MTNINYKVMEVKMYVVIYLHVIKSQRSILLFSTEGALDFNSQRGKYSWEKIPKKNFDFRGWLEFQTLAIDKHLVQLRPNFQPHHGHYWP